MDNSRVVHKILCLFIILFISVCVYKIENNKPKNNLKNNNSSTKSVEPRQKIVQKENNPIVDKINELSELAGFEVGGYSKITFEVSFYSDLNCENGFGNITATGKTLENGMIANNFLEFGTKVYIEGLGLKTVEDRGSKKYFNAIDKIDVFIPRNHGESDSEYYKRVNNLGRKNIDGYILFIGE